MLALRMKNRWMICLDKALHEEAIPADAGRSRFVPYQAYCEDLAEAVQELKDRAWDYGSGKHVAVLVDGTPKRCTDDGDAGLDGAFRETLGAAGFSTDWVVLSEALGIEAPAFHSSADIVEKTRSLVRSLSPDFFVVLGSGSITDVVKHSLFLEGRTEPFISVPTALTVTAFTSAFAIIDFHGAKRTQLSREVSATLWVESILECAPQRMSRAGYGDLLARFVAYGDWFLGRRLGVMDRYDETALRLMEPFADGIRENAGGFSVPVLPKETCRCIAAALAMAGIAMSVSGETTPLSGFEHVISHGLDFLRLTSGRELVFHGEQVGLACLTSARAIDWLLAVERVEDLKWLADPEITGLALLNGLLDEAPFQGGPAGTIPLCEPARIEEIREAARREFLKEYGMKARRWKEAMAGLPDFAAQWPAIKDHLRRITVRTPEMASLAAGAGLPLRPEDTVPPTTAEEFLWAVRFAPFVRLRTNIADVLFWMGQDVEDMIYEPD
jgi:glycerol-1-phosphate dehydrogenase [NAD(P)+]